MIRTKRFNVGFDYETQTNFITSQVVHVGLFNKLQWQKDSSETSVKYLTYTWILATYFIFVFVLSIYTAEVCNQLDFYIIYLTNWNVILNTTSSLFGAILFTLYYHQKIIFNKHRMLKLLKIYWFLSNLSTVVSISVAMAYWPSYNGRDAGLNDILTHAGNAIILFADTFIHARPPRYGHFIYPLSFGIFYVIVFSVPYQLLGGVNRDLNNYIYASLDWTNNTKEALNSAIMLIIALIIVHFIVAFAMSIRLYLHSKLYRKDQTLSNNSNQPTSQLSISTTIA